MSQHLTEIYFNENWLWALPVLWLCLTGWFDYKWNHYEGPADRAVESTKWAFSALIIVVGAFAGIGYLAQLFGYQLGFE